MKRSGVERVQSWRVRPESGFPSRARANSAEAPQASLGASGVVRRLRLAATKRKRRLGEPGLSAFPIRGAKRQGGVNCFRDSGHISFMPDHRARLTFANQQRLDCTQTVRTDRGVLRARDGSPSAAGDDIREPLMAARCPCGGWG